MYKNLLGELGIIFLCLPKVHKFKKKLRSTVLAQTKLFSKFRYEYKQEIGLELGSQAYLSSHIEERKENDNNNTFKN